MSLAGICVCTNLHRVSPRSFIHLSTTHLPQQITTRNPLTYTYLHVCGCPRCGVAGILRWWWATFMECNCTPHGCPDSYLLSTATSSSSNLCSVFSGSSPSRQQYSKLFHRESPPPGLNQSAREPVLSVREQYPL